MNDKTEWFANDDLRGILNVKGQLRANLREWVDENYQTDGKGKQISQLIDLSIDTFLDDDAKPYIGLNAPSNEVLDYARSIRQDFYTVDIEQGDILSFIDKALSFGYYISGPYPRNTFRKGCKVRNRDAQETAA